MPNLPDHIDSLIERLERDNRALKERAMTIRPHPANPTKDVRASMVSSFVDREVGLAVSTMSEAVEALSQIRQSPEGRSEDAVWNEAVEAAIVIVEQRGREIGGAIQPDRTVAAIRAALKRQQGEG